MNKNNTADDSDKFKKWLINRFSLRGHMFVILICTALSGVTINWILFQFNISAILLRYPVAVIISYLIFFLLIKIWLEIIIPSHPERTNIKNAQQPAGGHYFGSNIGSSLSNTHLSISPSTVTKGGGGTFAGAGASSAWGDEAPSLKGMSVGKGGGGKDGMALIAAGLLIIAIIGGAIYCIWCSPIILSEAALQTAMASGLIHHTKKIQAIGWEDSVFKKTAIPFAIVFGFAFLFGWVVHLNCPQNTTASQVFFTGCERGIGSGN